MYVYYLLAMYKSHFSPKFQSFLTNVLGRNVTRIQMTQFVTMIAQGAYTTAYSPYPIFFSKLLFFYIISLLCLFASFYINKFATRKSSGGAKKKQ